MPKAARSVPCKDPGAPPLIGSDTGAVIMAVRFDSTWGLLVPPRGDQATPMICPNCGASDADMDRVGNRVYGWHDRCGWSGDLRVVRGPDGAQVLEPWRD